MTSMTDAAPRSIAGAAPVTAAGAVLGAAAACAVTALWMWPAEGAAPLGREARITLIVTLLAVAGWVGTRIPESLVALAAALALVLTGAVPEARFFATLGSDLVWLLLAAFVIAAVARDSGLAARLARPLTRRRPTFAVMAGALTLAVAATAFVLPSTSGRAALLLPVFLALLPLLPDARLGRALALLFPTVILLSAGGSLIGAGAHLVAVEAMVASGAARVGYLDWMLLGAPLALAASLAGAGLILWLFVPCGLRAARMQAAAPVAPDARQARVAGLVALLVALWITEPWHGIGMSIVAVLGAVALLTPPFTAKKPKELFRAVDVELILYMAATMLIAEAMIGSGADRWLAARALAALPEAAARNGTVAVVALSVIAVAAHLVITSRSARAAVLIPAIALPMAGLGHDAVLMILIAVMGTGFCQTMMASAKPVAIFGLREEAGFAQGDLFRLALWLAPVKVALLVGFALLVWPQQLAGLRGGHAPEAGTVSGSVETSMAASVPASVSAPVPAPVSPSVSGVAPVEGSAVAPSFGRPSFGGPVEVAGMSSPPAAVPSVAPPAALSGAAPDHGWEAVALPPLVAAEPRPEPRPKVVVRPSRAQPVQRAGVGERIRRDFARAGQQIERDLRRLFR